jgi:hypothetical protein
MNAPCQVVHIGWVKMLKGNENPLPIVILHLTGAPCQVIHHEFLGQIL